MDQSGKIRVWTMVADSYRFVLSHPRDLARVGWLPLIALFALNLWLDDFGAPASGLAAGKVVVNVLVLSLIAAIILVAWQYSRLRGRLVLKNPKRIQVLDHISNNPGKHYRDLSRDLDMGHGTLSHHVKTLEREGYIKSQQDGQLKA